MRYICIQASNCVLGFLCLFSQLILNPRTFHTASSFHRLTADLMLVGSKHVRVTGFKRNRWRSAEAAQLPSHCSG